jgi:glycosyltransferase involved in cell wall biosynthesis
MRIAVNTRLLQYGKLDGIGWFTYETLKRITHTHPEVEFILIFDRQPQPKLSFPENVRQIILSPPTRHPVLWYLWFEWRLPSLLKKLKPDLFLSPDGYLSLRTQIPQLAVIHDINFIHRPKDLPMCTGAYYRYYFPKFAARANRIATVSEYSKQDICRSFEVSEDEIDVVYNGANEIFGPVKPDDKETWKLENTSGTDFLIYVGTLHPRKNISGILYAFEEFKRKDTTGIQLMIVGEPMFKTGDIFSTLKRMNFRKYVILKGRLEPEELRMAIGSAKGLLLMSFFEGFGIPVLEALKCHVPVICSNSTSLPEVAGNAAIYADPGSVKSITQAMNQLVYDDNFRQDLIRKGQVRAELFSWERTSELLWKSIEKTLK